MYQRDTLNSWRRLACWVSGHGEGWALYAERLMADLGFLDDPGDRLGMLDGQRMRAARVVLDIGVHLGTAAARTRGAAAPGTRTRRWRSCSANVNMPEGFVRFEWTATSAGPGRRRPTRSASGCGRRPATRPRRPPARAVRSLDLRAFHARALSLGSVGLDVLREALT